MEKFLAGIVAIFVAAVAFSCKPLPELGSNEYRDGSFFPLPSNLKGTGAFLVLERNGKRPEILASGNLINRENGLIRTAKHFTDAFGALGVDYCKVFLMNGKVYKAALVKVPPIRDAALIRLIPPFSVSDLPYPLPMAPEMPKPGDKVFVQGFHPHAFYLRQENREEGFPDNEIKIFETYYGQITKDRNKESQVVFDNLTGMVVKPDPETVANNPWLSDEEKKVSLKFENDKYIKVLMAKDHKFSFGGLSGGVALNENGEAFGVITAQDIFRLELDDKGFFFMPGIGPVKAVEVKKQYFDTIYITPLDSIGDLAEYAKKPRG